MLTGTETEPHQDEPLDRPTWLDRVTLTPLLTASTAITTATLVGLWKLIKGFLAAALP